ncbi:alpha/beta hydrolase [Massilia sp. IC2-476]|uniref:alpha/beta hydrolase n=1 Tax=Massilia sp. IC2-476 TaxID=2887199 RepID=UPI001D1261F9|nr:alpha/beta fold hydrolase [Massilia sp. IC2-476]MCC2973326.1 alpha/beta fold hydrolase [Massilia sp. IC2-476]
MKRLTWACATAVAAAMLSTWVAGSTLIAGKQYAVAAPDAGLRTVRLATPAGRPVEGWLLPGEDKGALLLLHGIRADRTQMLARARFLQAAGYAVLLIDLPGHGASPAPAITFGLHEGAAVKAALDYLRGTYPGQRVGVIGVSLGAASYVLCADCPRADAVVLESMYPTIEEAVQDRLRMRVGPLAAPLSQLLLVQLPLRLDIEPEQLRPIERMPALDAPVLIAAGDADQHTTIAETRRIFAAAGRDKALWEVPGAAHVDLYAFAPAEYERRVGAFLARHLGVP